MAWRNYADPNTGGVWWTDAPVGATDPTGYSFVPDSQYRSEGTPAASAGGNRGGSPYTVSMPSSPLSMVGGLDQIALQQNLLNNQYQRQRFQDMELPVAQATLSGYLPKAWSQAQQGRSTQAGGETYNTANGPRTLQQMRDEIVAASRA